MDRNTLIFAIAAAALLACVVMSPVACTMQQQKAVADAIRAGADPIEARCAMESNGSTTPNAMCIVAASRERLKK